MKPSPTLWLSSLVTQPSRYRSFIEGKGNKGFNVTERSVSLEMVPQVSWGELGYLSASHVPRAAGIFLGAVFLTVWGRTL